MTPPNLSRQALRDIEQAVDDMVEHGASPAYAEHFAVAVAQTAEKIARRPMLGHRRLELLPENSGFGRCGVLTTCWFTMRTSRSAGFCASCTWRGTSGSY